MTTQQMLLLLIAVNNESNMCLVQAQKTGLPRDYLGTSKMLKKSIFGMFYCRFTQPISLNFFLSATPCASPPPWPSIFSNYSFGIHQPVNQDDQRLLAHAMASDFSVAWQFLSKRTIIFFVTDQTPRTNLSRSIYAITSKVLWVIKKIFYF
jgi:hypothetical protein